MGAFFGYYVSEKSIELGESLDVDGRGNLFKPTVGGLAAAKRFANANGARFILNAAVPTETIEQSSSYYSVVTVNDMREVHVLGTAMLRRWLTNPKWSRRWPIPTAIKNMYIEKFATKGDRA